MTLDRAAIARLIPHQGPMCLLDSVVAWSDDRVVCHSEGHRASDNPLRSDGRLSSLHAIEYAAQAMAVHQRLSQQTGLPVGYGLLVSARDVSLFVDRLDTLASPLVIDATRIAASAESFTYRFSVSAADTPAVSGRASVLIVEQARQ
jgi:predicted hotdog family 3-hydroxylacyl-ACP dehydratase